MHYHFIEPYSYLMLTCYFCINVSPSHSWEFKVKKNYVGSYTGIHYLNSGTKIAPCADSRVGRELRRRSQFDCACIGPALRITYISNIRRPH